MNDMEFANAEINFKSAVEKFVEQCQQFGVEPNSRIYDAVYSVLWEIGIDPEPTT